MTSDPSGWVAPFGMKIEANDFDLFELPKRFEQNLPTIESRRKALLLQVHPDRFASDGEAAQLLAMQWSLRVNEAYRRLKDPLERAAHLCVLNGVAEDRRGEVPARLLQQLMSWRERLDEAKANLSALDALQSEVQAYRAFLAKELATALDEQHDWLAAFDRIAGLRFVERLALDIGSLKAG